MNLHPESELERIRSRLIECGINLSNAGVGGTAALAAYQAVLFAGGDADLAFEAALNAVRERLGPAMFEKAFRFKPEVSLSGIRYLQQNEPDLYAIAAQAFTATPGKASVRAEVLDVVKEVA